MASLQKDPSGNYHISIAFAGRRFKRSLKTSDLRKASAACARVQDNISLIETGRIELPDNVDLPTFLLSDTKLNHKPKVNAGVRLGRFFEIYRESVPEDSMEATSLYTARLHMKH